MPHAQQKASVAEVIAALVESQVPMEGTMPATVGLAHTYIPQQFRTCLQIVPNFRVRTIPVLGTMPAMFGLAAASHILCQLAGLPFHPEPIFKLTEGQYETQLQRLTEREDIVFGNAEGPAVDLDDVSVSLFSTI